MLVGLPQENFLSIFAGISGLDAAKTHKTLEQVVRTMSFPFLRNKSNANYP